MKSIIDESVSTVFAKVEDPATGVDIKRAAFEAALKGIRSGTMTYEGDLVLPMI